MVASGTLLGLGIGLIDAGINTYIANKQRNANLIGSLHAFYGVGALLGPTIATTTGSKTRLATHLPGLCWGCGADGCRHALGSYVQIQPMMTVQWQRPVRMLEKIYV